MQERQKHIDAFDTYYGLGTKRSLAKLYQHLTKTAPSGTKVTSLISKISIFHGFLYS